MKKFILTLLLASFVQSALAYDYLKDGIYYSIMSEKDRTVAVVCGDTSDYMDSSRNTSTRAMGVPMVTLFDFFLWTGNSYAGDVVIPEVVQLGLAEFRYTVKEIHSGAFCNCPELKSVTLPATLDYIGIGAFANCPALEEVVVPPGVGAIDWHTFSACTSLKRVSISPDINIICSYAFSDTRELETLEGFDNITYIGDLAFAGSGITEFPAWEKLEYIRSHAFENSALKTAFIPENCSVQTDIFNSCAELTLVSLPSTVKYPDHLFKNNKKLSLIRYHATTPPPLLRDWAADVAEGCILEVPEESVNAYKAAENWKNFPVIRAISTTDIKTTDCKAPAIHVSGSTISITGAGTVRICDTSGKICYSGSDTTISLPAGLYIVTADNLTERVLLR